MIKKRKKGRKRKRKFFFEGRKSSRRGMSREKLEGIFHFRHRYLPKSDGLTGYGLCVRYGLGGSKGVEEDGKKKNLFR